jgi:hypothetical protein
MGEEIAHFSELIADFEKGGGIYAAHTRFGRSRPKRRIAKF